MSFGSLTAIALGIVAVAWWGIHTMNIAVDKSEAEFSRMSKAKTVVTLVDKIYLDIWSISAHKNPAEKQAYQADLASIRESYKKILGELKADTKDEKSIGLMQKIEDAIGSGRDVNNRVIELSSKGQETEAIAIFGTEGTEVKKKIEQSVIEFMSWREKQLAKADEDAQSAVKKVQQILIAAALIALIVAIAFGILITRSISTPIKEVVQLLNEISNGDLTHQVPRALCERKDEAGDLARAMDSMSGNLNKLMQDITEGIHTLASASTELTTISSKTTTEVKAMGEKATMVAAAAEESSANTVSVAASMEQASTNLGSVAAATEEMSATVADIASNSEKARVISEQAIGQTRTISTLMQQLGKAAQEIGKVTETINDISSQTNLLALNATIEAARAGAAGKGFAVVANEIKELARQTATATEDIKAKISGVQSSAGGAITDIEKIAMVINDVGGIVANIAAAIEEQATVTKDVAGNIAQASTGVKEANTRIAQTATVSSSIAQDIASVNGAVNGIREGGEQVQASATELSMLAEQLQAVAGQFKIEGGNSPRSSTSRSGIRPIVPWKPEYSVGVSEMDAQHKKLLDLINKLHAALKRGEGSTTMGGVLNELIKYTEYHFSEEEEILEQAGYKDLPAQKKAHVQFVNKVKDVQKRWENGDASVTQELMNLLANWLPQHILKMDKPYGAVLNKR